jgi:HD-GYP domain-containing protein (c-di-GMP phosphodiesterase class II)
LVEQIVSLWLSDPDTIVSVSLLNHHSDYEYKHSVQVASMCIVLATLCYELTRFELIDLGIGGLLHDLGKIYVPKEILSKPGKLTEEESALVKKHPEDAYVYLKRATKFDENVLTMIRDHHEALDGSGYPRGIKGTQIGRNSRIVSIADIFCALISERSYRPAYTHLDAMSIMKEGFNSKLDLKILNRLDIELRKKTT